MGKQEAVGHIESGVKNIVDRKEGWAVKPQGFTSPQVLQSSKHRTLVGDQVFKHMSLGGIS